MTDYVVFRGFKIPEQNWSKLPHELIDQLHLIKTLGELACVLYVLRHTWGFSEFDLPKKITTDEFMNGRKRKDGTRLDKGTGLSAHTIIDGLVNAVEHGFLIVEIDDKDKARVKKYYSLNMYQISYAETAQLGAETAQLGAETAHRTEKETTKKETIGNNVYKASVKEKSKKHTSKRRDGTAPDPLTTILGFAGLSEQARAGGKAWQGREQFTHDDRLAALADKAVELFGIPMGTELYVLSGQVQNLFINNVTPQDLQSAYEYARDNWTMSVTGLSDGLVKLARAEAKKRAGGSNGKTRPDGKGSSREGSGEDKGNNNELADLINQQR